MAYADCNYYLNQYLLGRSGGIPNQEFRFWEKQAEKELDRYTFGRIRSNENLITDDVRDCACAIADLLYRAHEISGKAYAHGLAGPLQSWSNDGESGSVDLGQSVYTEIGKQAEIRRIVHLYLGNTGLLYQGAGCCINES